MKSFKTLLVETLNGSMESYTMLTYRIGTLIKNYYSKEVLDNEFDDLVSKWIEYMIEMEYVNKPSTHIIPNLVGAMQRDAKKIQIESKLPYYEEEEYDIEQELVDHIIIDNMINYYIKKHSNEKYDRIGMVKMNIDGYTLREVAEKYGVDSDTVRRCIEKQLRSFRHPYSYRLIKE